MTVRRLAVLALTLLLAAPALAQEPPPAETPPPTAAPAPAAPAAPAADAGKAFAKKGIIEIEGGIGFEYDKGGAYAFTLSPAGRYFLIDSLSVGLRFDVGYSHIPGGGVGGDFNTTSVGFVPMAEYNLNLGGRLFPYGGLGIGYHYSKVSGGGGASFGEFDIGAGVKMTFGKGGILGLGIMFPVYFNDNTSSWAFQIITRYGVYF